jgi:hypothetical protein
MVNILTGLAINSDVPGERTPPISFRMILASLLQQTAAGAPVPGILPAPGTPLAVLGSASAMSYTVKAGYAVTTRASKGAYVVGTPTDVTVPTAAAHSTLPRIDRIYIVQPDPELSETGVARIDVVNGTPASTPTVPALPAGALELARKTIAAGATNTNAGAAMTDQAATTALNIGKIAASAINDPLNLNVGKINGSKITSKGDGIAPTSPAVGDIWVDWS